MNIIYCFLLLLSYLNIYFQRKVYFQHYAFQGHPLCTKGDIQVLGIVQEFL